MHNIYLNQSNEGYDYKEFKEKFIEICNEHRDNNKALAFSFILYDFDNPQVSKILHDEDYWMALNKLSGEFLTIFSFNYKKNDQKKQDFGFEYMTNISTKVNLKDSNNNLLGEYFENTKLKLPCIIFFQVNKTNVTDLFVVELDEKKIEESFLEIQKFIESAVDGLKSIKPENKNNYDAIFYNLKENLNSSDFGFKVIKIKKYAVSILSFIASIIKIMIQHNK